MASHDRVKVAILGASGYSGIEAVRILAGHPFVEFSVLTSEHYAGREVADVYRHLAGRRSAAVRGIAPRPDRRARRGGYLVPAGAGRRAADRRIRPRRLNVIDVSADFRLKDPAAYRATYGADHPAPALLKEAVYGLSEFHRHELREARAGRKSRMLSDRRAARHPAADPPRPDRPVLDRDRRQVRHHRRAARRLQSNSFSPK